MHRMKVLARTGAFSRCPSHVYLVIALLILSCLPLTAEKKAGIWSPAEVVPGPDLHPQELLKLAEDFRTLRRRGSGIPDYDALIQKQKDQLPAFRSRLEAIDPSSWEMHFKIDYLLLRAEMDALEFDLYVWCQTERNPSLYVNAAIGNVERLLTGGRRMGDNPVLMPYKKDHALKILQALADTEEYLSQAKKHLTGFAPELADIALRHPGAGYYTEGGQLKYIVENYKKWAEVTAAYFPPEEAKKLVPAATQAAEHLLEFGRWLEDNRDKMKGKYFIDKKAVDWYFRNVMLMPYTADQILFMAEIERARAITYLQFELQKNRHLPKIEPAKTTEEYLAWDDETSLILRRWYLENGEDILSDQEYQTLIRSEEGLYLLPFGLIAFPKEAKPGVHRIVVVPADHWRAEYSNMGFRTDPAVLHGHEYWPGHTYEGKHHAHNPCPIRRGHRDGAHSEGWCFYNEEILCALDFPFIRGPRARELVYTNMLQRAERRLLGLPLLLGKITPDEAFRLFIERNPPLGSSLGVRPEEAYEEMEGFITSTGILSHQCMVGKYQLFELLADRKMQLGEKFNFKEFHDQFMKFGQIPISLLRWEILGFDDEAKDFWNPARLSTILN